MLCFYQDVKLIVDKSIVEIRLSLILYDLKDELEAASGFEPLHRGFADLSLNHLGTPPSAG